MADRDQPINPEPPRGGPFEITRDALGRPLVNTEERRRLQALELACSTSPTAVQTGQNTNLIIRRAAAFTKYLETGVAPGSS
jgi:hypothetical protein